MDSKKKITIGVAIIIFGVVGYLLLDMFGGDSGSIVSGPKVVTVPNPDIPKKAELQPQQAVQQLGQQVAGLTERERQLMALQKETETKYLAALNELQMLKVEKDIAETNKDISVAKLDMVTAQVGIKELLAPPKSEAPAPDAYAHGLDQAAGAQQAAGAAQTSPPADAASQAASNPTAQVDASSSYTVVSVSKLRGQWTAVLGSQGKLMSVREGDVLSGGSTVLTIDNSGVLLERGGNKQKISMMPII
jgi:hypothetical protein